MVHGFKIVKGYNMLPRGTVGTHVVGHIGPSGLSVVRQQGPHSGGNIKETQGKQMDPVVSGSLRLYITQLLELVLKLKT